MTNPDATYPVLIIGGGPVGLFLALCLKEVDIECLVLEKRTGSTTHSKSIGIHPVSIELFDRLHITERFLDEGLKIHRGHAFIERDLVGTLTFKHCPAPHRYVLAVPQFVTERILTSLLEEKFPGVLKKGMELQQMEQHEDHVLCKVRSNLGTDVLFRGTFLVGCDGKDSRVRQAAGIPFDGGAYEDTYVMGDFTDNTRFGTDAAIFLTRDGLIESFPLPVEMRRWVVKTDDFVPDVERSQLERLVHDRLGYDLSHSENFMLSSFGVQHYRAREFVKGNIILAGDAAHVISPIGGQGMNLGWLDAWRLADLLDHILHRGKGAAPLLDVYRTDRRKAAVKAERRAEFNMALGRKTTRPERRRLMLKAMLSFPLNRLLARAFTMRGLEYWPV